MHILVVDDDQAVRDSLKRSLEYNGYEVSGAEDGVQALARLAATRPDAVIMDVMMPRLDGLETTRRIRSLDDRGRAGVPIVAVTANAMRGDEERCRAAGMNAYLTKPIDGPSLLATVERMAQTGVAA